jgi:hypothetical protein
MIPGSTWLQERWLSGGIGGKAEDGIRCTNSHEWLRGQLRDWAEEALEARRLRTEGLFGPKEMCEVSEAYLSGRTNEQHRLCNVLIFEAWIANQSEI